MTESKMQLVDWLDDLCVRFIINLPQEELESVERICFQVEEAQWFYEDFIRPLDPSLPSMSLRNFCLRIFQHCPLLSAFSSYHHSTAFSEFLAYKTRVPVRGAIMLNDAMDEVVLVKGWKKGANWSFPRGKINKDEKDLDCAVREVYEETGFDIKAAGLVKEESEMKFIEVTMREQHMRLYVFRGVPKDTPFEPRTRKEISKIQWYKLSDLPTIKKNKQQQQGRGEDLAGNAIKFYMVAPFLVPLKKWIAQQHKKDARDAALYPGIPAPAPLGELAPEVEAASLDIDGGPECRGETSGLLGQSLPQNGTGFSAHSGFGEVQDRTAQLKQLLAVSTPQPAAPEIINDISADSRSKSDALLAMLQKGGRQQQPQSGLQGVPPPQTPLEQLDLNPNLPQSPHPRHAHQPPFHMQAPPPSFPLPPAHAPGHPMQQGAPAALVTGPGGPSGVPHLAQQGGPAPHHQLPQPHIPAVLANLHMPSSDLSGDRLASSAQFPGLHIPAVSAAPNVPPSSLSNHSLALLNVLRAGQTPSHRQTPANPAELKAIAGLGSLPQAPPTFQLARPHVQPRPAVEHGGSAESDLASRLSAAMNLQSKAPPATAAAAAVGPAIAATALPESHKNALLALFKQQPATKAAPALESPVSSILPKTTAPAPVPVAAPVAAPVPPAVQVSTKPFPQQIPAISAQKPGDQKGPSPSILKRPLSAGRVPTPTNGPSKRGQLGANGQAPAIIPSPLHPPQFDTVSKDSPRNQRLSPAFKKTAQSQQRQPSPISILPRPASVHGPKPNDAPKQLADTGTVRRHPAKPKRESKGPREPKEPKEPAKPFQPQILRRPTQPSPSPGAASQNISDRRESQTDGQRQALLSLFSKPAAAPTESPLTSPIAARPEPALPAEQPSISRLESISSDTATRRGSQADNKNFLLGYLAGVAKAGRG
ncbi:hypothetical protein L228DRAFT_243176 [Xylona heveae TC161]|uniref:Nudix hydrolase domain-containing protein n=1 Tax=Xylona heveae (strain CBS 132557 / TC161) TaxID=1328760 RepID=A0A165JV92_XYLHT|nr:hypothetical protein L228DRAFT_243176 [Xylona heveae TC161]KZF26676.1 hypothetical protein L228DRAFT_243176 [Xylona heveae TC161]